jgi:hypothetical protein
MFMFLYAHEARDSLGLNWRSGQLILKLQIIWKVVDTIAVIGIVLA